MSKSKRPTFVPHAETRPTKGTYIELVPTVHKRVKENAHKHGLSMRSFMVQAIVFAMDHMEDSSND